MKESFQALSFEALSKNSQEFLQLARETLARQTETGEKELTGKKELIDQSLREMKGDLERVNEHVANFERDREKKYGELSHQLRFNSEQMSQLKETTHHLRAALASTKARGQWGERMAEDVLKLAGFVEGVNYLKNKAMETTASRPDYTFILPQGRKLNMDVKFPLNSYLSYLEAEGEMDREEFKDQFLRDAKSRIKEVTTRDYINPQEKTLDYCLVFIPNEQVYGFIHEHNQSLLDEALGHKVVLCSPLTLYAILAVIRQAVDNFSLESTASEILTMLASFNKQWELFIKSFEKMGKRIDDTQKEFHTLTTTRSLKLDRVLRQIDELRKRKGIEESDANSAEPLMIDASQEDAG